MNDDIEVWAKIEGYPNYEVSSFGNVRRRGRILKPKNRRYLQVHLSLKGVCKGHSIHRLVAEAFIPNPDNKPQVNHIDGNKHNNHVSNLEWVSPSENIQHAIKNGLIKINGGENPAWRGGIVMFSLQGERLLEFERLIDAVSWIRENTKYTCADCASISRVCHRKRGYKKMYGYIWRWKKEVDGIDKIESVNPELSTWKGKVQVFTLNMELVKEFESLGEVTKWFSLEFQRKINLSDIVRASNRPTRSAYGYRWTFEPQKF